LQSEIKTLKIMAYYDDNAPIKNTCPIINDVVGYIEGFREEFSNEDNDIDFYFALGVMEDIRAANLELRNWGNDLYRDLQSLEKERDALIDKVDESEHELMRANVRIDELEDWVEDLQQRIAF
jgi:chromosome segregation ATPase